MLDQLELRDMQVDSSNAQLVTYLHESRLEMEKLISLLENQRSSVAKRCLRRLRWPKMEQDVKRLLDKIVQRKLTVLVKLNATQMYVLWFYPLSLTYVPLATLASRL